MIALLAWLTISTPFVYSAQQKHAIEKTSIADDESCNPFGNNTEEKTSSGSLNLLSEEFLHHTADAFHVVELFLSHHCSRTAKEYVAFHGEMLCPPPNA